MSEEKAPHEGKELGLTEPLGTALAEVANELASSDSTAEQSDGFSQEEKVKILLAEYTVLRQEINSRIPIWFQLFAITAAAVVVEFIQIVNDWLRYSSVAFTLGLAVIAGFLLARDILIISKRLRQLEQDINRRAGEKLLVWETMWGAAVTGYGTRRDKLLRQSDEAKPDQR